MNQDRWLPTCKPDKLYSIYARALLWVVRLQGTLEVGVFLAPGESASGVMGPGDVGFAPQGSGHYLRNIGSDFVRL